MLPFVIGWLRQPTSVAGFAAILGAVSGVLGHQITLTQAVPVLVGAAVSILLPDNTAAAASVQQAAQAIVNAAKNGGK